MADPTDRQQLLISLIGDVDAITADTPAIPADGILYATISYIWDRYADKALTSPRLRELYVLRDACDLWLGIAAPEVSQSGAGGMAIQLQQRFDHFQTRRKNFDDEIVRIEEQLQHSREPVAGQLSVVEPISPPSPFALPACGPLNANDSRYAGSPYVPRRVPRDRW